MSSATHVTINGLHGEGGSATFRTSLVMSALTQQPVRIFNVRGATRKPGLTPEDLTLLNLLQASSRANVLGDELNSAEVIFEPKGAPKPVNQEVDIHQIQSGRVPGNIVVIAQSALPVLARTGRISSLDMYGETHLGNSLGFDAFEKSTIPAQQMQGLYAAPAIEQSGFGFGGRGKIVVEVEPSALNPIRWDRRGDLIRYGAVITHTDAPNPTVREIVAECTQVLQTLGPNSEIEENEIHGTESGISITFYAQFECGSGSGSTTWSKGTSGLATANKAWENFQAWFKTDATVDSYLADQLLTTAAITDGRTVFTTPNISRRLISVASVIKQFLPIHITIKGRENTPGTIIVER